MIINDHLTTGDVMEFDYIVIGAGSAGCVVAARLSESGQYQVALLEAGGSNDNFWIRTPLGYGKLFEEPEFRKYNWSYESEPETGLGGRKIYQPRGKVLGGTGSLNGMDYVRGQKQDFDHWRELGNVGWGYGDVLPFFIKCENNERGASAFHGADGPLRISNLPKHELAEAFIQSAEQLGYARNDDFNGAQQEGFGYHQANIYAGRRFSTADAYLAPARNRANLTILTEAAVNRVVIKDRKAVGVEFRRGNNVEKITARREVILCGGSFNSPQLLQLSGIGPANLLRGFGIPVEADLSGVGENLQDHFNIALTYRSNRPITVNDAVINPIRRYAMALNYLLFRRGFMATNGNFGTGFIRTDPSLAAPDAKIRLRLWSRSSGNTRQLMGIHPFSGFGASLALIHPDNRGSVRIRSADAGTAPEIRFNYFQSDRDRQTMLRTIGITRKIMSVPAMAENIVEEMIPGPHCASDGELIEFCRSSGNSGVHPSGTCRMGIDDGAVVSPRLQVRGINGLRVIDASVMPTIVGAPTNAATIMIGEKGASMILEDALSGHGAG